MRHGSPLPQYPRPRNPFRAIPLLVDSRPANRSSEDSLRSEWRARGPRPAVQLRAIEPTTGTLPADQPASSWHSKDSRRADRLFRCWRARARRTVGPRRKDWRRPTASQLGLHCPSVRRKDRSRANPHESNWLSRDRSLEDWRERIERDRKSPSAGWLRANLRRESRTQKNTLLADRPSIGASLPKKFDSLERSAA